MDESLIYPEIQGSQYLHEEVEIVCWHCIVSIYLYLVFQNNQALTEPYFYCFIWVGFWGFILRWGGGKLTPCLKFIRIMKETSDLARKYTHICSFIKYIVSTKTILILLMSAYFFCKKLLDFSKNSTFTQSSSMRHVLKILFKVLFSELKRSKGSY